MTETTTTTTTIKEARPHRSVSQYTQYYRCPHSYELAREEHVPQRPGAWLPQGLGVHHVAELREHGLHDREHAAQEFENKYVEEVNKLAEDWAIDHWFWSGRYNPYQDIERRRLIGLEQVEKFYAYCEENPQDVLWITPDGKPGVEVPFEIMLGDVPVKGFIDRVVNEKPRDLKSGKKPGTPFQLAVYGEALEQVYGLEKTTGDFYMASDGAPTVPYDLREWSRERLTDMFGELDEHIKAGDFEADPEPGKCRFCAVRAGCKFF